MAAEKREAKEREDFDLGEIDMIDLDEMRNMLEMKTN